MLRVLAAALIFLPLCLNGQSAEGIAANENTVLYHFTLYSQADGKLSPDPATFSDFLHKTAAKRGTFKEEKAFVYYLFNKTHHTFLKRFQEYASFRDLVENGIYNCLTASALVGLVLDYHDIEYRIMETNYHVFLLVSGGTILLEATDSKGFVDNPAVIRARIAGYQTQGVEKKVVSKTYYEYRSASIAAVNAAGILGLLHYNNAVRDYNSQKLESAISHLQHALLLHRTEKMEAFLGVISETIRSSGLYSADEKTRLLQKLEKRSRVAEKSGLSMVTP